MVNTNCSVPNCSNVRKKFKEFENNISYNRFPKNETTTKNWLKFCLISKDYCPMVICSIYFERDLKPELMNLPLRNVLNSGAVPTIWRTSKNAPQASERLVRDTKHNKAIVKDLLNESLQTISQKDAGPNDSVLYDTECCSCKK